jgi:O-glycosyl hydrolase
MLAMTYDATTKIFNGYVEVSDENSLPANATLVKPDGIVQPYTWDGTKWTGQSESDFEAEHPATGIAGSDGPTAEQQMINALGLQVASLQATVTKLTITDGGAA